MSGDLVHKPLPTIPPYKPQPTSYYRIVNGLGLYLAGLRERWAAWEKKRKARP